jgi:hypothetical protein
MSSYTLSTDKTAGFSDTFNFFTISATGSVQGTGVSVTLASNVYNVGHVDPTGAGSVGINLTHAGYVLNEAPGEISGSYGIKSPAGTSVTATVVNRGVIGAQSVGVDLLGGGIVNNSESNSQIYGYRRGIYVTGGNGTITNEGTISTTFMGYSGSGINIGTGTVTNIGSISSSIGVTVRGNAAITNLGAISSLVGGSEIGVYLEAGGSLTNGAGVIVGYERGVESTGGSVTNFAVIGGSGPLGIGVQLNTGASLTNGSTTDRAALIDANFVGVATTSPTANVANFGTLSGSSLSSAAVDLDGGVLTNGSALDTTALVDGPTAVTVTGAGTITNFGVVESTSPASGLGALFTAGGKLTNGSAGSHAALIEGGYVGVEMKGAASAVTNFGTIQSTAVGGADFGVELELGATGQVTNGSLLDNAALIQGYDGVFLGSTATTLSNFGTVQATITAVEFADGGALTNGAASDPTALIAGGYGVIGLGAATTVSNFGTISSTVGAYAADYSAAGGKVTNGSGGDVTALLVGASGVEFKASGTVVNYGAIIGQSAAGVLAAGGTLINGVATDVTARIAGVGGVVESASAVVNNLGVIDGSTSAGVVLEAGGKLMNGGGTNHSALIEGYDGVQSSAVATISNSGTILATGTGASPSYGVGMYGGGTLKNGSLTNSSALIEGYGGVRLTPSSVATNFGTILGAGDAGGDGVYVGSGSSLTNGAAGHAGATVSGYLGVFANGGSTVTNFGTIIGQGGVAVAFASPTDVLAVEAGSTFVGAVNGSAGTIDLASGAGAVSLLAGDSLAVSGSMTPTTFSNFGTVEVGAGASFTLTGTGTVPVGQSLIIAGTLTAAGSLTIAGSLTTAGTLAGTGSLALTGGSKDAFNTGTLLTIAKVSESSAAAVATVGSAALTYAGVWTQTAGTLTVAAGDKVSFSGAGDSFAGTLTGAGSVAFTGGSDALAGTTLSAANVTIGAATVTLSGTINNASAVSVSSPSVIIAAAGVSLTGAGSVNLSNLATNKISGASAATTLTNVSNKITGAGLLGNGVMTLVNDAAGTINGNAATALTIDTGAAVIVNAGLIEATGAGGVTITGAVNNTGTLTASGGNLTVQGAVTGAGIVNVSAGTADFASTFSQNVTFTGTTGVLELANSQGYAGSITGFAKTPTTTLDLGDIAFVSGTTKASFSGTTASGVLTVTDGTHTANIKLTGNYTTSAFTVSSDGHGGADVLDPPKTSLSPVGATALNQFIAAAAGLGAGAGGALAPSPEAWRASPTPLVAPRAMA